LLRNVMFNGRIASLPPVAQSQKGSVRLIRPMVYVSENLSTEYAKAQGFLPIACVCSEKESIRREIREFMDAMKSRHVGISDSITAALGNVNLYTLFGQNLPQREGAAARDEDEDDVCAPFEF
jgi:tRNA(Ile)-lysidine synthase TilS/MesJ